MENKALQKEIEYADNLRNIEGDLSAATKVLEPLLEDLKPDEDSYYEIILRLSSLYRDNKSYETAEDILTDNIDNAKEFNKPIYLADIYRSLAFIELQKRNFSQAKEFGQKAIDIVDDLNDEQAIKVRANIYAILGNIEFTLHNYKSALDKYEKGLDDANKINFIPRILTIKNDIANVYIEINDLEQAKETLLSIQQDAETTYRSAVPQVLMRLAKIEFGELNYDKVKEYLEKSISISEKEGWKRDIAEAREGLARLYKVTEKTTKAQKEIQLAYEIYIELGLLEKAKALKL